jgi:hypothetical protein
MEIGVKCHEHRYSFYRNDLLDIHHKMSLIVRPIEENDLESCCKIGYEAHKAISSAHGYPCEQPSEEFAVGLIRSLGNPNSWGLLAERRGNILGSISFIGSLLHLSQ